ncbi:MAG: phosphatidylserine/phosphatidylglycerophosphate/cardiolipin synthase family protein [Bacteriovoracia bacterium]
MKRKLLGVSVLSLLLSFWFAASAVAIPVEVGNAPENDLALTLKAISGAKRNLFINIYEFTSDPIADAIEERIQAGVNVEILAENQPVGGLSKEGRAVQARLVAAMKQASGNDHFYVMSSHATLAKRRFRFDHGKYAVVDNEAVLIGSENYSPSGHPAPGTKGNRGWEVIVRDRNLAQDFSGLFSSDTSLAHGDVMDLAEAKSAAMKMLLPEEKTFSPEPGLVATAVQKITAPENSETALLALLNSARLSIDIEQMMFSSDWGDRSSSLFDAVVAAAKRGVKVRVLLNDESVFNHSKEPTKSKNQPTVDALNALGGQGYRVEARIANLKAMGVDYIHNKGLLVDGTKTLVSSINWDENSVLSNRETAVLITGDSVCQYFSALFQRDWAASGGI